MKILILALLLTYRLPDQLDAEIYDTSNRFVDHVWVRPVVRDRKLVGVEIPYTKIEGMGYILVKIDKATFAADSVEDPWHRPEVTASFSDCQYKMRDLR